jgi:[phosphatase 2A protein]-leucine-carboxy methyltransferase
MFSGGGVESTNDDASACKLSAVRLGYWRDDFIKHLVPSGDNFERRAPEIHLGYFTRVTAMFKLMEKACAEVGIQMIRYAEHY